jgi:hypothetical protein
MKYTLYFSNAPAPKAVTQEVIRGGQYPWLIEGPGIRLDAREIGKRCEPILMMLRGGE